MFLVMLTGDAYPEKIRAKGIAVRGETQQGKRRNGKGVVTNQKTQERKRPKGH